MGRPRHPKKEIEAAIQHAENLGWRVSVGGSHAWGHLYCPLHTRAGCIVPIWSTPKNPEKHAKDLRRSIRNCEHQPNGDEDEEA